MNTELLKILGQFAGIGGIGAGILLIIYKEIIRKNIFPNLKKDHAYYLLRLIAILVWSVAAIGIGGWIFIEYTKNSNVHKIEGKSDTWLRMKYTVCTGPYSHKEEMLGTTKQEFSDELNDKKIKVKRYLINNQIFKALKKIDALSGGIGVLTSVTLDSEDIKKIFNINYTGSKNNRIEKYFNYFREIHPDINFMKQNDLLPFYLKQIKKYNYDYNEDIDFSVYYEPCGTGDVNMIFYFRSLRTKFVVVDNISDKIIKNIIFHVESYEPSNMLQLNLEKHDKDDKKMVSKEIPFPIDILKKDESIVFPLEMRIVTPEYASGYIYESDGEEVIKLLSKGNVSYFQDEHIYEARLNEKQQVVEPVKEKDSLFSEKEKYFYGNTEYDQSIGLGPLYKIKFISFQVDGDNEKKTYKRDFLPENLIYVNDSCECGSCPLLFAENQQGQWRRLREIISEYRDKKNEGRFEYLLPLSAKSIKIKEMKGETSYFRDMAILVKTRNNNETAHYMDNYITVTADTSLLINLSDIKRKYTVNEIVSIKLAGYGYYQSKSKEICPKVLNLRYDYF